MAPLADLVGVSRQVAVLAYQLGDGFTNILVPTNVVLMGILAIAGVPYQRWVRFVLPALDRLVRAILRDAEPREPTGAREGSSARDTPRRDSR